MAAIDVGAAATDRAAAFASGYTLIGLDNPANETGTLNSIEVWAAVSMNGTNKVATFSRDGAKFTPRDVVTIGSIADGSKQTFTEDASSNPIALSVESGDYLGIYFSSGNIERDETGYSGLYYKQFDQTAAGEQTYTLAAGDAISLYATGETASATSIKTLFAGTPIADLAKFNGTAISDYKKINGISNVD